MLNRYLIPELRNEISFGHRGMFQEDVEIAIQVLERPGLLGTDESLSDPDLDRRIQTAYSNWQLTLNF